MAAPERFETFGPDHLALIALTVVGCVAIALGSRRLRRRGVQPAELQRRERVAVVALLAVTLPLQVAQLLPGEYSLRTSLPIQLCDLAWLLSAYALWTRRAWAVQLLYYWALTLVPQAILTPDLAETFPQPRYLMFWVMHLMIVWIAVHLTWGPGTRVTWRGYRVAVLLTAAWMASAMALNAVLGTNYGFLNGKPTGASALDLLPSWPTYVVVELVVVAAVWALMTWPWVRARSARIGADQGVGGRMDRL